MRSPYHLQKFALVIAVMLAANFACSGSALPEITATAPYSTTATTTALPSPTQIVESAPTSSAPSSEGGGSPLEDQLQEIDNSLSQSMQSSIAYNAPASMKLDDSVTIQLLINPSVSPPDLGQQVTENGQVVTTTIEITPLMKADLVSSDKDAFDIQQLHDNAIQPIGSKSTTTWEWVVTARKTGAQKLTLVISRLIKAQGQDHWTIIKTFQADVDVQVTMNQWLQSLDWKWIIGILVTALLIPAFWRWVDQRKKRARAAAAPGHAQNKSK